jgi:hypothetical protein
MPSSKKPEFVFRGTTEGYPGGQNSIEIPYTCTSTHPLKALWFALECFQQNPDTACIYIARTENLKEISSGYNHFHKLESEIGFFIRPASFYPLCKETPKATAATVRSIVGAVMPVCKKIINL